MLRSTTAPKSPGTSAHAGAIPRGIVTKISNGQDIINGGFAVIQGKQIGLFYVQTPLKSLGQLEPDGKTPYISANQQSQYAISSTGYVTNKSTNMVMYTAANDLSVDGHAYPDFISSLTNRVTCSRPSQSPSSSTGSTATASTISPSNGCIPRSGVPAVWAPTRRTSTNPSPSPAIPVFRQLLPEPVQPGQPASPFVENGSFIRLRDLSLIYDLSRFVVNSHAIKRLTSRQQAAT
jgi:hypothetical protein